MRHARFLVAAIVFGLTGLSWAAPPKTPSVSLNQKASSDANLVTLRSLLQAPESRIDLAKAKVAIDHMIDSKVDTANTLRQIDTLATRIEARFPAGATNQAKLELLVTSLSQSGPWNDYRPFSYDLDDPLGKNIRNKLLSTYLATRKGNCVSMPVLLVVLGQKLGLDITLATAPLHVLAKFRNDQGQWINIEATSFGTKRNESYQQELGITPRALANGIYLRPLGKRESVGEIMGTLMEFYGKAGQQMRRIAVADLALQANPRDTTAMLQKGNAYYRLMKAAYMDRYPSQTAIPPEKQTEFAILGRSNMLWFQKAEALGWVEPTATLDTRYLQTVQRIKAHQRGR